MEIQLINKETIFSEDISMFRRKEVLENDIQFTL